MFLFDTQMYLFAVRTNLSSILDYPIAGAFCIFLGLVAMTRRCSLRQG